MSKYKNNIWILRYKNIFAKGYISNCSEEVFVIKKVTNTEIMSRAHVIIDLNGEEIVGTFSEKELQKPNHKEFRVEKLLKRKGDKVFVKWKS